MDKRVDQSEQERMEMSGLYVCEDEVFWQLTRKENHKQARKTALKKHAPDRRSADVACPMAHPKAETRARAERRRNTSTRGTAPPIWNVVL